MEKLRKICFFLALLAIGFGVSEAQALTFVGGGAEPIRIDVDKNTGLDGVYVLRNAAGVEMSLPGETASWHKFGFNGAAFAEEIGTASSIKLSGDDCGYVAEVGTRRYYFWIVNYANHTLDLQSLGISDEQECDRAYLTLQGNASPIYYATINGQRQELSRELTLKYNTLEYDEDSEAYMQKEAEMTVASIGERLSLFPPLCDTYFTLSGDRFLRQWGEEMETESPLFHTTAVEAHTYAVQDERTNDNEQSADTDGLGGSAPCTVHFSAAVTDAAIFIEWQISKDPEFNTIDDRYRQLDFDYTFQENGTVYVRFVCDNDAGTCEYIGETYEVFIGESALLCPNAFSPGASEGVNDEWKVSYKSIVSYQCNIFNRWGIQLFSSNDPSVGWDGKYKGKLVPSGAYYYVIKAVGSDGKKYDLSGDINILHSKNVGTPTGGGLE